MSAIDKFAEFKPSSGSDRWSKPGRIRRREFPNDLLKAENDTLLLGWGSSTGMVLPIGSVLLSFASSFATFQNAVTCDVGGGPEGLRAEVRG